MNQPSQAHQNAVSALLTPQEQQQLQAAGVNTGIIAGLIRAFIQALLTNLPGIVGTQQRPQIPANTAAQP